MLNKTLNSAILELIERYKNGTWDNKTESCSICKVFGYSLELPMHKRKDCNTGNCINQIFSPHPYNLGCLYRKTRGHTFGNNPKAIAYWTAVLELVPSNNKKFYLSEKLKESLIILDEKIAQENILT